MSSEIKFIDICLPSYFQGYAEGTHAHLICFPVPSPNLTVLELRDALIGQEMELPEHCPISQDEYFKAVDAYVKSIPGSEDKSKSLWEADTNDLDSEGNFKEDVPEMVFMYFALEW